MESNESDGHDLSTHDKNILNRIFNPNLPYSDIDIVETVEQDDPCDEVETESVLEAKLLEVEGVKAAENADFMSAIEYFNKSISIEPQRASGYNNRAQTLRLINDQIGAMEDLNKSIELSDGLGKTACQAYTQRALLYKLDGKGNDALEDFKRAANLGGAFAKQMVVSLNPYAALCNQMMAEMITKLQRGEPEN